MDWPQHCDQINGYLQMHHFILFFLNDTFPPLSSNSTPFLFHFTTQLFDFGVFLYVHEFGLNMYVDRLFLKYVPRRL